MHYKTVQRASRSNLGGRVSAWGKQVHKYMLIVALAASPISASVRTEGVKTANRAIELIDRTMQVEFPAAVLEGLREPSDRSAAVLDVYGQEPEALPRYEFLDPISLKRLRPSLAREIKRFWQTKPSKLLKAVPYLASTYHRETGIVQDMIFHTILGMSLLAIDVDHSAEILVPALLSVVENSGSVEHQREAAEGVRQICAKPADAYLAMMRVASDLEIDCETRASLISGLNASPRCTRPPAAVTDFLLTVATGDRCDDCRVKAIDQWQLETENRARILPVYLRVLAEERDRNPRIAAHVIFVVGMRARLPEVVPHLVWALDSVEPFVQATAIRALEIIRGVDFRSIPASDRVYSSAYDGREVVDATAKARLTRAADKWKTWAVREGVKTPDF